MLAFGGPNADSWHQILYLVVAVALCGCIGFERELRGKSAGIRTNAVIGLAAALIMEVSKFGFGDVVSRNVDLDPSRVAAQVVSGIGFVGAGIIFVQRGTVRGLTTASTAWMAAAIGLGVRRGPARPRGCRDGVAPRHHSRPRPARSEAALAARAGRAPPLVGPASARRRGVGV